MKRKEALIYVGGLFFIMLGGLSLVRLVFRISDWKEARRHRSDVERLLGRRARVTGLIYPEDAESA